MNLCNALVTCFVKDASGRWVPQRGRAEMEEGREGREMRRWCACACLVKDSCKGLGQ